MVLSGNISGSPAFINTKGEYYSWDLHLQESSPCIDQGSESSTIPTDADGTSRPFGDRSDMGAYEYTDGLKAIFFVKEKMETLSTATIEFTEASTGTPDSWAWDFDHDGVTDSTDQNPSHTYETGGWKQISLTITKGTETSSCSRFLEISKLNQPIYFVKTDGDDAADGQSWDTAFKTFNGALEQYEEDSIFWVKEGVYAETSITVPASVRIYGGFAGTETDLSQRDIENHPTVIDRENTSNIVYNYGMINGLEVTKDASIGIYNKGTLEQLTISNCATEPFGGALYNHDGIVK